MVRPEVPQYQAPWWLLGGHLQTIWPALYGRKLPLPHLHYRRTRWTTPDRDFIDVDWLDGQADTLTTRPLLVLFHGLEGSSASHYARAFADHTQQLGWSFAVAHFRGCSGEMNLAPRAYHSGDYLEVDWILKRFRVEHRGPLVAVGISLGGNALLRWAEESGDTARCTLTALAAVCAPLDLAAGGAALGRGLNRLVYTPMFLRTMKPRALRKLQQYPGLFNREALLAARDLHAFDDVFTAPLHGFKNTDDYWAKASAKPQLGSIRVASLVLNARNDPFVPASCLPSQQEAGSHVTLWQPAKGGHVGFAQGMLPGNLNYLPQAVGNWLHAQINE